MRWAARALPEADFERIPSWSDVKDWPGKIVGACDYACREQLQKAESWDEGYPYWWDLSEVVCFDSPISCRGNVGMWQMPRELALAVTAADIRARLLGAKISSAADAARVFRAAVSVAGGGEGIFVLPLDANRRALSEPVLVSLGTESTTDVRPGDVLSVALKSEADSIVVAHNHPSGDLRPSRQDMQFTTALSAAAESVGVKMLDHLIIDTSAKDGYTIVFPK